MKYTASIGLALAMSSSLVQGAFQYNLYSDKSCQNFMGSFKGDSGGNYNGVTQDYDPGMYVGSVVLVEADDATTQLSWNNGCVYFAQYCCRGAPSCKYTTSQPCMELDDTVSSLTASFTVCDSACFDTGYKRDNLTAVPFTA